MSELMFEETRGILVVFLKNIMKDACVFCEYRRAKTLKASDVVLVCPSQLRTHTFTRQTLKLTSPVLYAFFWQALKRQG